MRIALDTHILIYWVSQPDRLTPAQHHAVQTISRKNPAVLADISLWEIAMLAAGERLSLQLQLPLREWITAIRRIV